MQQVQSFYNDNISALSYFNTYCQPDHCLQTNFLLSPHDHTQPDLVTEGLTEAIDQTLNDNDYMYSYYMPQLYTDLDHMFMAEPNDLTKNLVKDVFFSPAINEPLTQADDNFSIVSSHSSSSCSSCSPSYSYDDLENKENEFTSHNDSNLFFYGLELDPVVKKETIVNDDTKLNNHINHKSLTPKKLDSKITKRKYNKSPIKKESNKSSIKKIGLIKKSKRVLTEKKRSPNTKSDNKPQLMPSGNNGTLNQPRSNSLPTIYQTFSKKSIDWCRYCGTTEGVNWRPGPWGKRTLCNKHGCDYKGYGFACKLPRLDLSGFQRETIDKRIRPVLQLFCSHCHQKESWENNTLVFCEGCPKSYHQQCHHEGITDDVINTKQSWYCSESCKENLKQEKVIVELPRRKLPLMRTPKDAIALHNLNNL